MKTPAKIAGFMAMAVLLCMAMALAAIAAETITITKANGGDYTVMAYNTGTRTYYALQGKITSDSHRVRVPDGYGSIVNVALSPAVGSRNLYEKNDPLNPIIEVREKSTYVLELVYVGRGSFGAGAQSAVPKMFGGPDTFKRVPPP